MRKRELFRYNVTLCVNRYTKPPHVVAVRDWVKSQAVIYLSGKVLWAAADPVVMVFC